MICIIAGRKNHVRYRPSAHEQLLLSAGLAYLNEVQATSYTIMGCHISCIRG